MSLVQRVQAILLRPKETWPVIAAESADVATLYSRWIVPLAAIPPIAGFIGVSLIGVGGFGMSMRMPIVAALVHAVVIYVLSLVVVYGLALLVDALAPTFGGTRSRINALKVVAYASTAGFVGGIFAIVPGLGVLSLIASLYGIYLYYTGLPVLMHCPRDKAAAYTAVVIVCAIVAFVVLGAIASALSPAGMWGRGMAAVGAGGVDDTPTRERVVAGVGPAKFEAAQRVAKA